MNGYRKHPNPIRLATTSTAEERQWNIDGSIRLGSASESDIELRPAPHATHAVQHTPVTAILGRCQCARRHRQPASLPIRRPVVRAHCTHAARPPGTRSKPKWSKCTVSGSIAVRSMADAFAGARLPVSNPHRADKGSHVVTRTGLE